MIINTIQLVRSTCIFALEPTTDAQGKCSHGGKFDTSATTSAAVGGINKETNSALYSPLVQYHKAVSDMAIKHTKYFFAGQSNYNYFNI